MAVAMATEAGEWFAGYARYLPAVAPALAPVASAANAAAPYIAAGLGLTVLTWGAIRGGNKAVQDMQANNVSASDQALVMNSWASGGLVPLPMDTNKPTNPVKSLAATTAGTLAGAATIGDKTQTAMFMAAGAGGTGAGGTGTPGSGGWWNEPGTKAARALARGVAVGIPFLGKRILSNAALRNSGWMQWVVNKGLMYYGRLVAIAGVAKAGDYAVQQTAPKAALDTYNQQKLNIGNFVNNMRNSNGWVDAGAFVFGDVPSGIGKAYFEFGKGIYQLGAWGVGAVRGNSGTTPTTAPSTAAPSPASPTAPASPPDYKKMFKSDASPADLEAKPNFAANGPRNYKAPGGIPNPDLLPTKVAAASPSRDMAHPSSLMPRMTT